MPIYEYVCRKCRHAFEVLVRGNEQPECPQCGDRKLDKLLSVSAAHSASHPELPPCGADGCPARGGMGTCDWGPCGM
jgi:putative FmdB family regulatory protein